MYRVLDRTTLVWALFILFGISLGINALLICPDNLTEWVRVIWTAPGTFAAITWALGATPVWRWIWTLCPPLSRWVYPDLNGTWATELQSNIRAMAEFHPDFASVEIDTIKSTIPGKFEISQNWFRIHIRFDAADKYSNSDTLTVEPRKDAQSGKFSLSYIYKNKTAAPKSTDEQFHLGAADLEVSEKFDELRGPYWTNRNASKGLNTAGLLVAKRIAAERSENQ